MSFDSRNGTRGARQPGGRLMRWFNGFAVRRLKKGGRVGRSDVLVLGTIGKKTGELRETPVAWFRGSGDNWLIVASAGGAAKNPAWYYNIAARPDRIKVSLAGQTFPVQARQLHGDERAAAWKRITTEATGFAGYETKTDREIPVIELSRQA